jgi:SAM-dependent methyltransferase
MKSHPSISRSLLEVEKILDFNFEDYFKLSNISNSNFMVFDLGCGVGRSLWELGLILRTKSINLKLCGLFYSEKYSPESPFYENANRQIMALNNPEIIAEEFSINRKNQNKPKLYNYDASLGLDFESESVDLIYSTNAFHYFKNKLNALVDVLRVLKVNGTAIINLDRTDEGFWSEDLSLPRLQVYNGEILLSFNDILDNKLSDDFEWNLSLNNSYGTGKNSYILKVNKRKSSSVNFDEYYFDADASVDLDDIRISNTDFRKNSAFNKLLTLGIEKKFKKPPKQEYFGGFLSVYKLTN